MSLTKLEYRTPTDTYHCDSSLRRWSHIVGRPSDQGGETPVQAAGDSKEEPKRHTWVFWMWDGKLSGEAAGCYAIRNYNKYPLYFVPIGQECEGEDEDNSKHVDRNGQELCFCACVAELVDHGRYRGGEAMMK